jgi:hypothetical protein
MQKRFKAGLLSILSRDAVISSQVCMFISVFCPFRAKGLVVVFCLLDPTNHIGFIHT